MANIRVDSPVTIADGLALTFRSPVDISKVTGLKVYYPKGDTTESKVLQFADAHGQNIGNLNLFASNVIVKVILDTASLLAYVQNADTNAYLENELSKKYSADNKPTCKDIGAAPSNHSHTEYSHDGHSHSAGNITGGTFAGEVYANYNLQSPGTSLLRNSKLSSIESNPTINGEICWIYV